MSSSFCRVISTASNSGASSRGTSNHNIKGDMVLPEGIELSTSPLPRECSTTELRQRPARNPAPRSLPPEARAV